MLYSSPGRRNVVARHEVDFGLRLNFRQGKKLLVASGVCVAPTHGGDVALWDTLADMEVKAKKTVRLDVLLKNAGRPVQVTLWTKPEDDRDFMRAVKDKRVVTVIQHNVGTKKDYGLVGFHPQERATYLIFPKPLGMPDETKVVGIKYDQLATAEPKGAIYTPPKLKPMPKQAKPTMHAEPEPPEQPRKAEAKPEPPSPEPPKLFKFQSRVELKATQTAVIEVEAASATKAAKLLKERAEALTFELAEAKVARKVGKPQKKS
jgi:hypothetical protein